MSYTSDGPVFVGAVVAAPKALLFAAFALILAACEEEQIEVMDNTRAIETITVSERTSGLLRRLPGFVEAVDTSSISFEVAGNTREVNVNVGDRIEAGQVLATLDDEPFRLDVEGAEADVGRAMAQLAAKESDYDRQSRLFETDWVSRSAYEEALAARDSFAEQVSLYKSRVKLARRDLEKTVLTAPFDGIIADKFIDPFQEVVRGETVFEIYREGAKQVVVLVPETMIGEVYLGLPAEITFPSQQVENLKGEVSEISTVASDANAFPIKVALNDPPESVFPGMAAEITFILGEDAVNGSYLIPFSAIVAGDEPGRGYVFVYHPESSTVKMKKTEISRPGIQGNQLIVTKGVEPGDVIVATGVTFLTDGQKVKRMSEQGAQQEDGLPSQSRLVAE